MRQIEILTMREELFQVVVQRKDVFNLLWSLCNSTEVSQFIVYYCGVKETNKDYHFGEMSKWVTEFTFSTKD